MIETNENNKLMMRCEISFVILTCAYVYVLMNEFLAGILLFLPLIYVPQKKQNV